MATQVLQAVDSLEAFVFAQLPAHVVQWYHNALLGIDPHSKRLPLMNPFHVVLIILAYLVTVFVGIAFMKNRQRMELKTFSLMHNLGLVILSGYMAYGCISEAYLHNFRVFGNAVDQSEKGWPLAKVLWLFYFSKVIEFVDTFIMVLKKNNHQVTFLHLYHHGTIFLIWWCVVYYAPGGDAYFSAAQNSLVHVIMYSYYLMTALGVNVWWKKYVTQIQMFQFALNLLQASYLLAFTKGEYPPFLCWILFWYMITLLALFMNFYIRSARNPRKKVESKQH